MKRPSLDSPTKISITAVALVMALAVNACSKTNQVDPRPPSPVTSATPATPALASASSSAVPEPADASAASQTPFTSWTEPAAAEALLRGGAWPRTVDDALTCTFQTPQQSCVPGSDAVLWGCVEDCNSTCETCGKECTQKLELCRSSCAKDSSKNASQKHVCELACAKDTGGCLDRCVTTRDRCRTGECNAEVAKYEKRVSSNFGCRSKANPVAICTKARACIDTCKDEACEASCLRKHAPGCDEGFREAVKMGACQVFDTSI